MAKEVSLTFKVNEKMADWIRKNAFNLDTTASEFIRTCILLSSDTISATPSLIRRISFDDRANQ